MKNKRINIFIFKLKFLLPRIMSILKKKKIKNNSNFVNFEVLVKDKNFSTYWFLNNYKIIARETIKGFKKDVLTKIHGGGATDRKRKLLEKQKKGKARSKQFGSCLLYTSPSPRD